MSASRRAYIYRVAIAASAVLMAYGYILEKDIPMWLALVGAVLGIGSPVVALNNLTPDPFVQPDLSDKLNSPRKDEGLTYLDSITDPIEFDDSEAGQ